MVQSTPSPSVIEMCSVPRSPHPTGDGSTAIPRSVPPKQASRHTLSTNSNRQSGRCLRFFAKLANFCDTRGGSPARLKADGDPDGQGPRVWQGLLREGAANFLRSRGIGA